GVRYCNKRAEIWGGGRDWLPTGCIRENVPGQDHTLIDELTGPTYSMAGDDREIQLERKKDMRRRGVPSPNAADALACTFAYPVYVPRMDVFGLAERPAPTVAPDYDPFAKSRMEN